MNVVDKIRAMLAKAASTTSEAEAMAFAEKAREWMQKHNVTEKDLSGIGSLNPRKRVAEDWEWRIAKYTARMFNCYYYTEGYTKPSQRGHGGTRDHKGHVFVGREGERITAELMTEFFVETIKKLSRAWQREYRAPEVEAKNYRRAAALRLQQKLKEQIVDDAALVVLEEQTKAELGLVTKNRKLAPRGLGAQQGWQDGDKIGINVQTERDGNGSVRIEQVRRIAG